MYTNGLPCNSILKSDHHNQNRHCSKTKSIISSCFKTILRHTEIRRTICPRRQSHTTGFKCKKKIACPSSTSTCRSIPQPERYLKLQPNLEPTESSSRKVPHFENLCHNLHNYKSLLEDIRHQCQKFILPANMSNENNSL